MKKIGGVFPTMITPFLEDGTVDYENVTNIVNWYADRGCHGIFAVCQSSEIFYLTLEERIKVATLVMEAATRRGVDVVMSAHVSDRVEEQIEELTAMCALKPAAVVLITNRMDIANTGDDAWIKETEALISKLPSDVPLGLYECPYPYKRLLSPKMLDWCISTGRFAFLKDTCCDPVMLDERCKRVQGTDFGLFNANTQTLLYTLERDAAGFSGVMANFHPELYVWLYENFRDQPEKAEKLQSLLSPAAFAGEAVGYPATAKYHMNLIGMPMSTKCRTNAAFGPYGKHVVEQIRLVEQMTDQLLSL